MNVHLLVPPSLLTWWVLSGSVVAVYKGNQIIAEHKDSSVWQKNFLGALSSWTPLFHLFGRERKSEKR